MRVLVLRIDAPLVSFGGPAVDQHGFVQKYPALSMLTGLMANALGWEHRDHERLIALQDRLRFAARVDRPGDALVDYQTVDLGQSWMLPEQAGWTTQGHLAERRGASGEATHQRWRHYRADSVHTVVVTLVGDDAPTVDDVAAALREPARPLFLGRKSCLPSAPILLEVRESQSLATCLGEVPRAGRAISGPLAAVWWADDSGANTGPTRVLPVSDERDWRSRVHMGRRFMVEGHVNPKESRHG